MTAFRMLPGAQILQMHETRCHCGADATHLILRPQAATVKGDLALQVRGYCDTCSPAVVREACIAEPARPAQETWLERWFGRWLMERPPQSAADAEVRGYEP